MLIHFGVVPYIVFDGDYLPSKAATEEDRAKRRAESKRVGLELYKMGKTSQAHLELQKAVDVTPQMAKQLIDELKRMDVQYVVAPYEADAQLAYLERKGIIQGILSEDSDLLVFGAKSLLTKLDQYGDCVEINRNDFTACREISLIGWTDADFRRMAILSGCDYLASINKMGLKTAYRLVRKHKTIEKILRMLQFEGQYRVPPGYLEAFHQAELTFLHQRVFCPFKNALVPNTALADNVNEEDLPFIGSNVEPEIATAVARGDLHPMTKSELLVDKSTRSTPKTPWASSAKKQSVRSSTDLKAKKPIDSFFKSMRTPLAELDPNSFTPSPSQQRLLQQNRGSWSSSPAPSRPPLPRSTASLPVSAYPTPESQSVRTRSGGDHTQPSRENTAHPSKRQRLCSDAVVEGMLPDIPATGYQKSPFFTHSKPGPSPSIRNRGSKKKPTLSAVNVWSDDSIEDVMADLPDISDFAQPIRKGKIAVFTEGDTLKTSERRSSGNAVRPALGESSVATSMTEVSECAFSPSAITNFGANSVRQQSAAKTLDSYASAELKALRDRFSQQPLQKTSTPKTLGVPKNGHVLPVYNKPLATSETSTPPLKPSHPIDLPRQELRASMTPLQRLGAGALRRPTASNDLQPASISSSAAATPRLVTPPAVPCINLNEIVGKSLERRTQPTIRTHGSEDMIVPDSEGETDGESPRERDTKPLLDLGRFVFNLA